jgi:hypothetical protein
LKQQQNKTERQNTHPLRSKNRVGTNYLDSMSPQKVRGRFTP